MSSGPQPAPTKQQGGGKPFLSDIQELRRRAREHIAQGAVTPGYQADRDTVVKLLNEALATEIVCTLRYKRHYFMAKGIHAEGVAAEFLEHSQDEQQHGKERAGVFDDDGLISHLAGRDAGTTSGPQEHDVGQPEEPADGGGDHENQGEIQGSVPSGGSVSGASIGHFFSPCNTARNASCGISTDPSCFMRFFPAFCFSSGLRLRVTSPP